MADKVGMSLDQIIKLTRKGRGAAKVRGFGGRGSATRKNDNAGRGGKFRGSSQERGRSRGRGSFAGIGRGRLGRGSVKNSRNTMSARQTFSPNDNKRPAKVLDAREKLKSKVDAREKLKRKMDAREKIKAKVDAREKLKAKTSLIKVADNFQTVTKKIHQDIRKEQRSNTFNERRKFDLTTTGIKITTKQEEREAEVMANSIKITAKGEVASSPLPSNTTIIPKVTSPRTLMGSGMVRILTDNKPKSLPSLPKMQSTERIPSKSRTVDLLDERLGAVEEPMPVRLQSEPVSGTRVIITNLHHQVSQADIEELFGVIGDLYNAKMLGEGVAEVIYSKREDAIAAFQKYHNRNLDGLPMQCRLSSLPTRPLYSPPTLRSDNINVSGSKPVVFKVKI